MDDEINGLLDIEPMLYYTGTQINYYFICKRKLWLFSNNITLESNSDLVLLGKILHEHSYTRETKEITIERIKIDFIKRKNEIHEVKRSKSMEKAHEYQLLYYLVFLKQYTGKEFLGIINYPLLKKKVTVQLDSKKEEEIIAILDNIKDIISEDIPPEVEVKKHCKSCAYRELCYV
jgi:CRISPR-associated exonuclease Cas4